MSSTSTPHTLRMTTRLVQRSLRTRQCRSARTFPPSYQYPRTPCIHRYCSSRRSNASACTVRFARKRIPARRAAGRRRVSDDALHACHRPARHAGVVLAGIAERTRFRGRTAAAASAGAHAPLAERAGAEGTRVRRRRVEETAAAVRALGAAQRGDAANALLMTPVSFAGRIDAPSTISGCACSTTHARSSKPATRVRL